MLDERLTVEDAERIIKKTIEFPSINAAFERVKPITDFRKDDDEARILYLCKRVRGLDDSPEANGDDLFVMKCKVQAPSKLPGGRTEPTAGPSEFTQAELQALTNFTENKIPFLPHLVAWTTTVQGSDGLLPHGYIAYTVMTLMPGDNLWDLKFWSLSELQRQEIRAAFILAIKYVQRKQLLSLDMHDTKQDQRRLWQLGFEPYDCALRNIIWEESSKTLSLVDFEHWDPTKPDAITMNETKELQRWGLVQRPPAANHWVEWNYAERQMSSR